MQYIVGATPPRTSALDPTGQGDLHCLPIDINLGMGPLRRLTAPRPHISLSFRAGRTFRVSSSGNGKGIGGQDGRQRSPPISALDPSVGGAFKSAALHYRPDLLRRRGRRGLRRARPHFQRPGRHCRKHLRVPGSFQSARFQWCFRITRLMPGRVTRHRHNPMGVSYMIPCITVPSSATTLERFAARLLLFQTAVVLAIAPAD